MEHWLSDLYSFFDPPQYKIRIGSRGVFGLLPFSISLHPRRFDTHMYIVGASGAGKSKFIQHVLFQLITKGFGAGLFDPHSDLASDLLAQLASFPAPRPWLLQRNNWPSCTLILPDMTI
jgi:DNA helicase HerA-like ATPase